MIVPSFMPRSCISSTTTWVTPFKLLSTNNLLKRIPVVQNKRRVSLPLTPSSRTLYPTYIKEQIKLNNVWSSKFWIRLGRIQLTDSPRFSPLSAATLSETDIADIRLGCVQTMLHAAPRFASISFSKINWGSWVVLPQPVSPETTITWKAYKIQVIFMFWWS